MTLDQGGMGSVEIAIRREGRFQRFYAIKRLHPHLRGDPAVVEMFLEEARLAGMLRHPNIVSVLDIGQDEVGPYLVMDFVDGVSVSQLARASRARGALLPVALCARIIADAANGLHAAHEQRGMDGHPLGLVHRDISPQNLLIGFDGVTRVTDFGIAKALNGTARTSTGVLKGRLAYMAPERLRFHPGDHRADLFALGVVWYELLAGDRLYGGAESIESARRILDEPPPDIGLERDDVPDAMVALLFSLLAKDPEDRPKSAREVAEVLEIELAALCIDDGAFDVPAYLAEVAGEIHATRKAMVDRALGQLASDDLKTGPTKAVRWPTARGGRWWWAAGGIAAGGIAVAAIATGLLTTVDVDGWDAGPAARDSRLAEPSRVRGPERAGGLPVASPSRAVVAGRPADDAGARGRPGADDPARGHDDPPVAGDAEPVLMGATDGRAHARPAARRPRMRPARQDVRPSDTPAEAGMDVPHWRWW